MSQPTHGELTPEQRQVLGHACGYLSSAADAELVAQARNVPCRSASTDDRRFAICGWVQALPHQSRDFQFAAAEVNAV